MIAAMASRQAQHVAHLCALEDEVIGIRQQQRFVKTGGRLVKHARYYWLLLAEGQLTRSLFGSMLRMIAVLPLPDE